MSFEASWLWRPRTLEKRLPPQAFSSIITPDRSEVTRDWMLRNSVKTAEVESAAWHAFVHTMLLTMGSVIVLVTAFGPKTLIYALVPALLAPLLLANRVANSPSRQAKREQRAYLRESPETIGTLAMNMRIQPSLEWAVGRVSKTCSGELSKRFARLGWEVLTRKWDSLDLALLAFIPSLSSENGAVGRSLHLVLASTYEPDAGSRDRVLDRANHTVIEGVKEAADHYVASLSTPALIIFALGIMLPVMLFSVTPLLSVSGIGVAYGSSSAFEGGWLFFLLLVAVPVGCLIFSNATLSNNPLAEVPRLRLPRGRIWLAPLGTSTILALIAILAVGGELLPYCLALACFLPTCSLIAFKTRNSRPRPREGERANYISALFQMGSRMAGGASFDKALEEIARNGRGGQFGACAGRVLRRARLDRIGLGELLENELSSHAGKDIAQAFTVVATAAEKDPRYAGKLALNLANNLSDIRAAELKMEENLHGVADMMRSTGMIFAPIVLGVTSSLMALTVNAGMSSSGTVDTQVALAMVYLAELVFCVSYFTTFLRRARTWRDLANDFSVRCPIALLVFTAVSLFARTGLSQLM